MMNRVFVIIILLLVSYGFYKIHSNEVALITITSELERTQKELSDSEKRLELMASTYAHTKDLVDLRESLGVIVASATVVVSSSAQSNINSISDLKRSIEDEETVEHGYAGGNALHPNVVSWLQRYESGGNTNTLPVHIP